MKGAIRIFLRKLLLCFIVLVYSCSDETYVAIEYSPVNYNIIDYITFATTGNAIDFGDCIEEKRGTSGLSDSHGGLGGY